VVAGIAALLSSGCATSSGAARPAVLAADRALVASDQAAVTKDGLAVSAMEAPLVICVAGHCPATVSSTTQPSPELTAARERLAAAEFRLEAARQKLAADRGG